MPDIILPHGNYQKLGSYRKSVIIFDATQLFCRRFLKMGDRTIDQMIQAARSGKQNIIEGCVASGISKETEIKLLGVARASLEELLEDYRDYLRTRQLPVWDKDSPSMLTIRGLSRNPDESYITYEPYFKNESAEVFCNILISLVHQANFLLDRQIAALTQKFTETGGLRERMYHARKVGREDTGPQATALLRNIYKDIKALPMVDPAKKQHILDKITQVAKLLQDKK